MKTTLSLKIFNIIIHQVVIAIKSEKKKLVHRAVSWRASVI